MKEKLIEAVANVVEATGFRTLAIEYRTRPNDRDQIVRMVARDIKRNHGPAKAREFENLAATVRKFVAA